MNGNACREVRQEIDQSELRQSLSVNSEAHLSACGTCQAFRDERLHLRELVGGLKPVSAPADFEMKLRARIARERDVPKQPFIFRLVISTPAIVVAAVLVIAVGAVLFVTQSNRQTAPAQASNNGNDRVSPPSSGTVAAEKSPEPVEGSSPANVDNDVLKRSTPLIVRNGSKSSVLVRTVPQAEDFGVRGAQNIKQTDRAGEVSLIAPTRPMVVTMYDEHGATRKIQLPPISFGSQRLTDSRTQVSMTNSKDW